MSALLLLQEENARLREALEEIASGVIKVKGRGRLGVDSFVVDRARAALGDQTEEAEDG